MPEYKINIPGGLGVSRVSEDLEPRGTPAWAWPVAALGIAGVTIGITCLFLSMRDVMEVGGACADGGPYVSAQPCPKGTAALSLLGIFGGLICLIPAFIGLHRISSVASSLIILAWGGLFGSLGYNFIYFAKNPPPQMDGTAGWWVCGVLFIIMALPGIIAPLYTIKAIESSKRLAVVGLVLISIVAGAWAGSAIADVFRGDDSPPPRTVVPVTPTTPAVPDTPVPPQSGQSPKSATQAAEEQLRQAAEQLRQAQEQLRQAQKQD